MLRTGEVLGFRFDIRQIEAVRWVGLAAVGVASLAVYWFGLVRPFSLMALGLRPHLDVASLMHGQPAAQINLLLTYTALLVLYYLAWRLCRPRADVVTDPETHDQSGREAGSWAALLATLAAINLAMLSLYPIGAVDVFDYIAQGREISVWHGNPFYTPADAFRKEPVLAYTGWANITTLYGPGWQLMAAPVTRLAGHNLLANLLAFKVLAVLFYAGCLALIAAILRRQAPGRALAGVCLFGLNPLVIYETAGNGHNDVVMVFWMLLAFYCLSRERHSLAALALTAGMLTKFVPGFLLPVVLVYSLARLPNWPARGRYLLLTGLACGALAAAVTGSFWAGGDMFAAQQRLSMLTTSLPSTLEALLEPRLGAVLATRWVTRAALGLTVAAVAGASGYVWRALAAQAAAAPAHRPAMRAARPLARVEDTSGAAWLAVVRASTVILLFYLLVACLWFQAWYTIWPLSLAALLPEGALTTLAVLLTTAGIWKPIYFDFFLNRVKLLPQVQREVWLGPVVLGLVWLLAGVALVKKIVTRSAATLG